MDSAPIREARKAIYIAAGSIATFANSSAGLNSTFVSAQLQEFNRDLQEALRMFEYARGNPDANEGVEK